MKRPFKQRMNFNAQGKGPLELPRLTNLGPMSETSTDIGEFVFRGGGLEFFNNNEFTDNNIDGKEVNMWYLDSAAAAKKYDVDLSGMEMQFNHRDIKEASIQGEIIDDLRIEKEEFNDFGVDVSSKDVLVEDLAEEGLIARKVTENVTGGLSSTLGSSNVFAKSGDSIPMIMFLERNRIPARLVDAKYETDFKRDHPAIAGVIDRGSNMLIASTVNDDYTHSDAFRAFDVTELYEVDEDMLRRSASVGDKVVKWHNNPIEKFNRLDMEQEVFAYTNPIDLDSSLFGICTYLSDNQLESIYKNLTDDQFLSLVNVNSEDGADLMYQSQIKKVYNYIKSKMESYADRLVMAIHYGSLGNRDTSIDLAYFYDGNNITTKDKEAIPFSDPSKF